MELRLPSGYQEVEYIENTGTQYIITDLLFPKDLENPKIEWGFMHIGDVSGDNMVFGYMNNGAVYFEIYGSITKIYGSTGQKRYRAIADNNLAKNMLITGLMTKDTITLNGTSHAANDNYSLTQDVLPMAIFAWKDKGNVNYINKGARIYYLRFYDGNTKMADYVPCYRKSDGEIGMYDTVTKTFYTNSGKGTFLKGADITRYIDNVSVLDTRRKILLNTPYIDTNVGDLITFNTDLSAPLKSCKVSFLPVQEGEGDPSPDNVRNITGWNGVSVTQECVENITNEYSIDWTDSVGTVYGGTLDVTTGELVVDRVGVDFSTLTWTMRKTGSEHKGLSANLPYRYVPVYSNIKGPSNFMVDHYIVAGSTNAGLIREKGPDSFDIGIYGLRQNGGSANIIYAIIPVDESAPTGMAVYKTTEPITYHLTPQQILTLKGTNNVYSDTNGQMEIKYWKH